MKLRKKELLRLELLATKLRTGVITMIHGANSGHPGGSLSITDILTCLYFGRDRNSENMLKYDPKKPGLEDRDRVVLSKGHAVPALYAVLAEAGYFDKSWLKTLRMIDSKLQGHPDMNKTPGIDFSTGSLGQGSSIGAGMAYAAKLCKKDYNVYVIVGDGELQEGINWEAYSIISHNKLNNLCLIVDNNNLQIDGKVSDLNSISSLDKRFQAFNFHVKKINGHNYNQIINALDCFKNRKRKYPLAIIANTIKGKGVKSIEGDPDYHGKVITGDKYGKAKTYFEKTIRGLEEELKKWA